LYKNGGGWLPHAIGSLGTDAAIEFLIKEFRGNPKIHGQVDSALMNMDKAVIPFILKEFDNADPKSEQQFFKGLCFLFKGDICYDGLKEKAQTAIPHLIKIAESKEIDILKRQEAIKVIGCIGETAKSIFPRLNKLADENPEQFQDVVSQAFIDSETSFAAEALVKEVENGANHYAVRDIALLGSVAKDIGPHVLSWLDHSNLEIRVMSARTLGAIGYKDAIEELEELLPCRKDWRMAYVATKSLAELRAINSIPALKNISETHWFPIVRNAAKDAIKSIKEGKEPQKNGYSPAGNLSDYVMVYRDRLTINDEDIKGLKPERTSLGRQTSFDNFKDENPALAKKFIEVRNTSGESMIYNMIEFPVNGGVLLGASAGEWTGGLLYVPEQGESKRLLQSDIAGITDWNGHILVASGMWHMGMNKGIVHKLSVKENRVTMVPWFVLPGEPAKMWVTKDEKLIISCCGGTLAFSDDDNFIYYHSDPSKPKVKESENILPPIGY